MATESLQSIAAAVTASREFRSEKMYRGRVDLWGRGILSDNLKSEVTAPHLVDAARANRQAVDFFQPDNFNRTTLEKKLIPDELIAMLASLTQGSIYTEAMFLHEAKIGQPDFIIDFFNFDQTAKRTIGALKITREVTSEGNQHRRDIESSHHHDDPYVVHLLGQRRAEVGDTVLEDISVSLPTADPKVSIDLPINDFLLGLTTLQKEGEGYSLVVPVFNGRKYCPTGMRILATEEVIQKACACLDNKPTEVFNKNFVVENLTQFVRNVT